MPTFLVSSQPSSQQQWWFKVQIRISRYTLLPLDSSLPSSVLSSGGEGMSSARQRRRRTTRKPGIEALARSVVILGEGGLELDTFESHRAASAKDRPSTSLTGHQEGNGIGVNALAVQNVKELASQPSLDSSKFNGRVRKKRSHHKEKKLKQQTGAVSHPNKHLEDSTDGVASLLQQQLSAAEQDDTKKRKSEVIANQGAELMPQVDSDGGAGGARGGHSSGVVTECEEDANQGMSDQAVRPLPPAINTEHADAPSDSDQRPDDTSEILGITIHGTDELQASVFLTHPSVRVSIFDASIENFGLLLKKSAPEKCVTSYYERGNPSVDYILPILTQPFECRHHRMRTGTLTAQWEETLTFNERPSHFTGNENVVICFELLDFVSNGGVGGYSHRGQSQHKPWHRIAWAFLRPGGKTCRSRMGKKIRLQLYKYPKKIFGHSTEGTEVYDLWSRHYRSTYPSTLYVTLSRTSTVHPQEAQTEPSTRSFDPLQEEKGSLTFERLMQIQLANKSFPGVSGHPSSTMVSAGQRLPGQPCQIPTSLLSTQYPTPMGCSTLAFSHSGHLLAAGCADQPPLYPLVLYEVPSFKAVLVMEGHRGIIYKIAWSGDDSILVSASADGLVKLWSLAEGSAKPRATLPHPCYIYCVCFITGKQWRDSTVLATGAYDGYVRIWSFAKDDNKTQITGEFHGHSGHVNCLVWSEKVSRLYAGDSKGIMGVWHRKNGTWMLRRKVDVMNGQSLISMQLHPNSRKMLLHTQKSKVAMLDLRVDHISCDYVGIQPAGFERCASFLSPCGGLVFAGSPTGKVYAWNADTGKELHVYSGLSIAGAVGALAFHPTQHMLAISSFGSCQPLLVFNNLKGGVAIQPKGKPTHKLGERVSMSVSKVLTGEKEGEDGGALTSSSSVRGSSLSLGGLAGMSTSQAFKDSEKFSDLVNTLDRVTAAKS